ncbi:MAG: type II secretion system major pseudopilin GspG [Fimbriimonadaceae bacterium]|nr:type II secretion system major pseudopilin GspG [Fimbriimonadaceae bacterium]
MRRHHQPQGRKGFTLIELLVVILILAVLAALIVPRVVNRSSDAKRAAARSDLAALGRSIEQFRLDVGRYPTQEEGLEALRTSPGDTSGWRGPYLTKPIPADPWGYDYVYEFPGVDGDDSYVLLSLGSDGADGGTGEAEDIVESGE